MFDYLISIKEQIGFYFVILKFCIYFIIVAIFIFIVKKIFDISFFLFKRFDKSFFFENLMLFLKFLIFIIISILVGWSIVLLITNKIF